MLSKEKLLASRKFMFRIWPKPLSNISVFILGSPLAVRVFEIAPSPHAGSQIDPMKISLANRASVAQVGVG